MDKEGDSGKIEEMSGERREPGVRKRSIETIGVEWAVRKRVEFPDRRADIYVIAEEDKEFLDLSYLGEIDIRQVPSWVPRVESITGDVYTSRWQKPRVELTDEGKHKVLSIKPLIAFGGSRYSEDVQLDSLPKSWTIARLIPQKVKDGLEAALRQQDEVIHSYKAKEGVEQRRIEEVFVAIHELTERLKEEIKTDDDLKKLAKDIEGVLDREGLLSSSDPIWQRLTDYAIRAAKKDLLDRRNPPASRFLARAAMLAGVEREVIHSIIRMKTRKVFRYCEAVRADTRWHFSETACSLEDMAGLGKIRARLKFFRGEYKDNVSARDANEVSIELKRLVETHLSGVQAAPYLLPAKIAEALLLGKFYKNNEQIEIFKQQLDISRLVYFLQQIPAEEYVRHKIPQSACARVELARDVLKLTLEDPDTFHYRVFD